MALEFLSLYGENILLTILAIAIASIPLYFAVKFMGGDTTFVEAMVINLIASGIPIVIGKFLSSYIVLLSFIAIIVVYMFFFKLDIGKSILAWLMQAAIIFGILWLLGTAHLGVLG